MDAWKILSTPFGRADEMMTKGKTRVNGYLSALFFHTARVDPALFTSGAFRRNEAKRREGLRQRTDWENGIWVVIHEEDANV